MAMQLAGHRNPSTHMRYVLGTERLGAPDAALPRLRARETPYANLSEQQTRVNSASPTRFERVTSALGKRCSIQLSYGDSCFARGAPSGFRIAQKREGTRRKGAGARLEGRA